MRVAVSLLLGLVVVFAFVAGLEAQDKQVTLQGTVTCAKCDLKQQDKCATVIKVKDKTSGKDVVYYFDTDSHRKNHREICTTPKEGTVTGKVSEKDGKKMVKVDKVEFKKD